MSYFFEVKNPWPKEKMDNSLGSLLKWVLSTRSKCPVSIRLGIIVPYYPMVILHPEKNKV